MTHSIVRYCLCLALLLPLGCFCTDPVDQTSYICLGEMSIDEEIELGDSYAPVIDSAYDGVYNDPAADQYMRDLIVEMAGYSVRSGDFTWKFSILNTSMPNAFAVPGGYIYITRGLLAAMETEGQFISVMGHELGHVEHRHSHQGMGRQVLGGVLVGIIGSAESMVTPDGEPGLATTVIGTGTSLFMLRYDRGQESQSDVRGVYYAAAMGYDPTEAVKTFEYFQKLEDEAGGSQIAWLRTHPLNDDRIVEIENDVALNYPQLLNKPKNEFRPYRDGNTKFQDLVKKIKQVQPVYDQYDQAWANIAEGLKDDDKGKFKESLATFQSCAAKIPQEALFHTGIGLANIALDNRNAAKSALQKAIQLDDAYLPERTLYLPHNLLGKVHFDQGKFGPAASEFEVATAANPSDPTIQYNLGLTYEKLGKNQQAIDAYNQVVQLEGNPQGDLTTKAKTRLGELGGTKKG